MRIHSLLVGIVLTISGVISQTYSGNFHVGGNSSNYYPVLFSVSGMYGTSSLGKLSVFRSEVHSDAIWAGTFHSDIEFIPSVWGNMSTKIASLTYITGSGAPYNDPIADIIDGSTWSGSRQLIIWLKGGATYSWSATNNTLASLDDANSEGVSKTSTSGQTLDIKTSQSALVTKAKNMKFHPSVGLGTDGNGYFGGNMGIGTNDPKQTLTVDTKQANSNAGVPAQSGTIQNGIMRLQVNGDSWGEALDFGMNVMPTYAWIQATNRGNLGINYNLLLNPNGGNIGIGTNSPDEMLSVVGANFGIASFLGGKVSGNYHYSQIYIGHHKDAGFSANIGYMTHQADQTLSGFYMTNYGDAEGTTGIFIKKGGNVGIGTTTPNEALTVKGKIHTNEVIIDMKDPIADYVFAPTYNLMPLNKVEQYVKVNSHLAEMPSASEVSKNGLSMGEMQNKLLQKVEELTLYVIDLQKTNEQQSAKIEELEKRLNR